ncbi:TIGR00282 family metallophosphoesterase, partial [Acidobacteria bacterium AH-259-O06]|nr:TIGR00282 family metallophosphoesterase [Acidobacteria bacterium AH-259-O06]
MKILFVGDVVGRAGRRILRECLPQIKEEHPIEFTIANVENVAGGFGITASLGEEILSYGVDVMTSGNHIWDKKKVFDYFAQQPRLIRPGNYPPGTAGNYQFIGKTRNGCPVAVVNLQGRVFMPITDCPFRLAEREIPTLSQKTSVIVIDFHAEATSEKVAFGWFMDGKVSAVIGTHTHVPTADARILPKGTAYISDVGMTGSYESVIGMKVNSALSRFLTGLPSRFEPATHAPRLCSVILDID